MRQKKVSSKLWDHNSQISTKNLSHNNTFIQPSASSINCFKRNYKKKQRDSKNYLSELCDTELCSSQILYQKLHAYKSLVDSSIDVMLTNKPRNFHHTSLIETGLTDFDKLILSLLELSLNEYRQKL